MAIDGRARMSSGHSTLASLAVSNSGRDAAATLTGNTALPNGGLGIDAVAGVIDGGSNRAAWQPGSVRHQDRV